MTWADPDDLISKGEAIDAQARRLRGGLRSLLHRSARMPGRGAVSESLRRRIAETERERRRVDAALVRECRSGLWA